MASSAQSTPDRPNTNPGANTADDAANVPAAIRVGGAFMALAIILFVFTFVEVVVSGWMSPFVVTPRFLMICAAAVIVGAYASLGAGQRHSISRVIALAVALLLIVGGRFITPTTLLVMDQWWLPAYGLLALACGLALRRSVMR